MISLLFELIFLPLKLVWFLVDLVFSLSGKLITAGLGSILMLVGIILCLTIIALPLGIILLIFGFLLCLKGIF